MRRVRGRGGGEYRELLNSSWGWPTTPWCVCELSEPRIELRFVWLARLAVCFNFLPYSAFCTPWDSNIWPVVSPPSVFCQLTLLAFEVGTFRSELFYSLLSSITPTLPLCICTYVQITLDKSASQTDKKQGEQRRRIPPCPFVPLIATILIKTCLPLQHVGFMRLKSVKEEREGEKRRGKGVGLHWRTQVNEIFNLLH